MQLQIQLCVSLLVCSTAETTGHNVNCALQDQDTFLLASQQPETLGAEAQVRGTSYAYSHGMVPEK